MKIRKICTILSILVISVFFISISAGAVDEMGDCGDYAMYIYNSGTKTLSVEGEGDMENYSDYTASPFFEADIEKITIEEGITSVGDFAFSWCENLKEISLPDTVAYIGESAFEGCSQLCIEELPSGLEEFGKSAFSGCEAIETITITEGVYVIPDYCFYGCTGLGQIIIPEGVSTVGLGAFSGATNLNTVFFGGDDVQWELSDISYNNGPLNSAVVYYRHSKPHTMGEWEPTEVGTHKRYCLNDSPCQYYETADCTYGEWNITKEPTCTATGLKSKNCTVCGYVLTEAIVKLSHTPDSAITENIAEPECEIKGSYDEVVYCSVCDVELSRIEKETSALTHSWSEGVINPVSTCKTHGTKTYICQNDTSHKKTEIVPLDANNHEGNTYLEDKTDATCTENGYTGDTYCSGCDAKLDYGEYIKPMGHQNTEVLPAVKPTCTTKGLTEGKKCLDCGANIVKQEVISATGHKYIEAVVTPTCTKQGYTLYTCNICGDSYKTVFVSSKGHSYTNACDESCDICGSSRSVSHNYKTTTTKATLKKNGKQVTKCTVCGEVKSSKTIYYPKSIKLSTSTYTCNGKVKTPTVVVKDSKGNTLKKDTDYTVKYAKGRKNPGKYTVTVTFKGKYEGTKKLTLTIKPKAPAISDIYSKTKGKAVIKWNNVAGESGYQLYYSTSKDGSYKKVTSYAADKTAGSKSKLKSGKTYYFKVRAYKKTADGYIYSSFSKIYSVKIR